MSLKRNILILILFIFPTLVFAQNNTEEIELNNDWIRSEELKKEIKIKDPMMPKGMIGIKYGYGISNVSLSQDIETHSKTIPLNVSLTYSTYTDLWDLMPYFGLQIEARYSQEGFSSKYLGDELFTVVDLSMVSQFHIDFANRFRILANIGPYAGYRISVNRDWNKHDNRFDYGLYGGAGFAIVFKPFEIHLEGNYKFSLSSYYHPNILSDDIWLFARPNNIIISAGIFFHLF